LELPFPHDWFYLVLRLGFVGLLYLFLWQVARIMLRDAVQSAQQTQAKPRGTKARLVLLDPAGSMLSGGTSYRVVGNMTIGRGPDCSIVIEDPSVSAVHARLEPRNHAWYVSDLGSTNGTFVNNRRVVDSAYIEADDIVQFGRMMFQFDA
jgi:pSer/pThr/pTyr-binding forkhead associated (FHA) protein